MSRKEKAPEGFTKSSGNVFADLGIENPEVHRIKADLVLRLNRLIEHRGGSQSQLAEKLGLQQPHVSQLKNYRLKGFSVERLMELLVLMGVSVDICVGEFPCADPELCVVNKVPTQVVVISDNYKDQGDSWHAIASAQGVLGHIGFSGEVLTGALPATVHVVSERSQWRLQ